MTWLGQTTNAIDVQRDIVRTLVSFRLIPLIKFPRNNARTQHTVSGHCRPTSETPFKWRFACGPILAWFCMPLVLGNIITDMTENVESGSSLYY